MTARTMGVEEEFLVVDPETGHPRAVARAVLLGADPDADLTEELQREQLETATAPCRELTELAAQVRSTRAAAAAAAQAAGVAVAALATSPVPVDPTVTDNDRYRDMVERFGLTGAEQLTCGCHVHVAVDDDEEGVAVLDRIRPWLAPLLALSANSPFWGGVDSRYASFRSQVWWRWPSAGVGAPFGSAAAYAQVEQAMVDTETVLDIAMVYFDARLSRRHPTVEIRVGDVCHDPDSAVLLAALTRGLVETAARAWRAGEPPDPVRAELLRLASWRAGRSGLADVLLDPTTWRPAPAADVLHGLVDHVAGALGPDEEIVRELLAALLRRGIGAARQRAILQRTGELAAVVADAHLRSGD